MDGITSELISVLITVPTASILFYKEEYLCTGIVLGCYTLFWVLSLVGG